MKWIAGILAGLFMTTAVASDAVWQDEDAKKEAIKQAIVAIDPEDGSVEFVMQTVNDQVAGGAGVSYSIFEAINTKTYIITNGDDVVVGTKISFSW